MAELDVDFGLKPIRPASMLCAAKLWGHLGVVLVVSGVVGIAFAFLRWSARLIQQTAAFA